MVNERVSAIRVTGVDPNIARLFALVGPGKIAPQPGIVIHRIGTGRFSADRMLEGGGKITLILEIVAGVLKSAMN
jgi:hypothetical protein